MNSWGLVRTGLTDFPDRYRDLGFLRAMLGEVAFPELMDLLWVCLKTGGIGCLKEAGIDFLVDFFFPTWWTFEWNLDEPWWEM